VRGYPDSFYVAVAAAYQTLAHSTASPIAALASANDVPHTTAQRWVREARHRGLLPPAAPERPASNCLIDHPCLRYRPVYT